MDGHSRRRLEELTGIWCVREETARILLPHANIKEAQFILFLGYCFRDFFNQSWRMFLPDRFVPPPPKGGRGGDFGGEEVFKSTEPWPFKIHSWEKKRARERKRRRRATEDEKKNWREAEGRREGERLVDIMHGIPSLSSPVLAFLAVGKKLFHSAYWKSSMYIIADATVAAQAPG